MPEKKTGIISDQRSQLFKETAEKLRFPIAFYPLGDLFEGLEPGLAEVLVLDVTGVPGCHYGVENVFVPIIHNLEMNGITVGNEQIAVNPTTSILIEPSTGNGWVAFSDAATMLGYDHLVIIPDGLPKARYEHPQNRTVTIIKTPAEDYAIGLPRQLKSLIKQNPERLVRGEKIFVSPDHAIGAAEITLKTMSTLGYQLLQNTGNQPFRVIISMGNGASLCALGEYVKRNTFQVKVVATESLAFGEGYDRFALLKGLPRYIELFGIAPANKHLMRFFSAYGTNAPIGIELPLQVRAISGDLIDEYVLFTDDKVLEVFSQLNLPYQYFKNTKNLPNYSKLPQALFERYGNSTLANIATALKYLKQGELVIAMAYDGRENYC